MSRQHCPRSHVRAKGGRAVSALLQRRDTVATLNQASGHHRFAVRQLSSGYDGQAENSQSVFSLECVRQAVFRATPLLRSKKKRCRACLTALLVTALQKILAFTCFVIFVDFVVQTPEATVVNLPSFHDLVNESGIRRFVACQA